MLSGKLREGEMTDHDLRSCSLLHVVFSSVFLTATMHRSEQRSQLVNVDSSRWKWNVIQGVLTERSQLVEAGTELKRGGKSSLGFTGLGEMTLHSVELTNEAC